MAAWATSERSAIEVAGLCVRYGELRALDGLDLRVALGGCFGLLGPNGAGKTTTVGVLTTLVAPDAGSARVVGRDVVREQAAVRAAVGIVFQEPSLDRELSAREQLDLHARLYHLSRRRERVEELLELVALGDAADRVVAEFSGGMKRRLEIARGLLHEPRVLFLDEPTLGLDVRARAAIWQHLRGLVARGETTIFLTTHSMEEADHLCAQLAILDGGRVVAEGSPAELKSALGGDVVRIRVRRGEGAAERIRGGEGVAQVSERELDDAQGRAGTLLSVTVVDGSRRLAGLLEALREHGVEEVDLHRPSLDDVFLHHTGHAFEPGAAEPERKAGA